MAQPATASPAKPPRAALAPGQVRVNDVLTIAAGTLVVVTIGFALLGKMYFAEKLVEQLGGDEAAAAMAQELAWTYVKDTYLWSFAAFSVGGTAVITAAVLWPREVGHAIGLGFGVTFLCAAAWILVATPMPAMVGFILLGIGALMLALVWSSWTTRDRAAWAFLLALSATLTIVMFFGTPRIKSTLADPPPPQFYVLLLPAAMAALAVACYRMRRDYR